VARKNARRGAEDYNVTGTVERGIAESRDGGKETGRETGEKREKTRTEASEGRNGNERGGETGSAIQRYVVCAWRGWRLPHEALRAELSYPHWRAYVYAKRSGARGACGAGPDLITLPYT